MYYLAACNTGLFKSYYCNVLFLPFEETPQVLWKMFLIPSPYIYDKKNHFINKYKKQMCHNENKCLFFDVMKKRQYFPSNVCHYDNRLVFSSEIRNIRSCKEVGLQKLVKCEDSVLFGIFQIA